jgi:hypothetical protein
MDIHKPKSWHGWREFLKEHAIIVVGVLTALAAEYSVVWLHDHHAADEAWATIDAEVVSDITRLKQRGFAETCVTARLDALNQLVDAAGPDGGIRTPNLIGRPPRYGVESTRWEAASQSGRNSLLPADWQASFGFIYTMLRYYCGLNNDEQAVWSRLDAVSGVDRLTPEMKLSIKADIAQARFYNGSMASGGRDHHRPGRTAGPSPDEPPRWGDRHLLAHLHAAQGGSGRGSSQTQ